MRYINLDDVKEHLELDTLDNEQKFEQFIIASEKEVDTLTSNRWDKHLIENEFVPIASTSQEFLLPTRPLINIQSMQRQTGEEWSPVWEDISSEDYRVVNSNISKIKTKDIFYAPESLRCSYYAGYALIPVFVKELTLLLVEKRYLIKKLGVAATDTETVSVAVIRISDKSNASYEYKTKILDQAIKDALKNVGKSMKSSNFKIGFASGGSCPNARYRC